MCNARTGGGGGWGWGGGEERRDSDMKKSGMLVGKGDQSRRDSSFITLKDNTHTETTAFCPWVKKIPLGG